MALDPERASFLLAEYRRSVAASPTVKADYANARTIDRETNLSTVAGGDALASELLALLDEPARVFDVQVEAVDVADLSQFDGSPPVFTLSAPRFAINGSPELLPAAVEIDFAASTTRLTLRG